MFEVNYHAVRMLRGGSGRVGFSVYTVLESWENVVFTRLSAGRTLSDSR